MGCMCPSVVVRLTIVGTPVGGAGPWPSWLQDHALCDGCGPLEDRVGFLHGWLCSPEGCGSAAGPVVGLCMTVCLPRGWGGLGPGTSVLMGKAVSPTLIC